MSTPLVARLVAAVAIRFVRCFLPPAETSFWAFGTMSCPAHSTSSHTRPSATPTDASCARAQAGDAQGGTEGYGARAQPRALPDTAKPDTRDTAQALGSGKKSSPGSGSARGGASIPKAPHRSTPKSTALAGLDDTAANSPRASPPAAGAGAVAVEDVEVAMEGMALEAPASQDPKQRVLSQVNLAELPGTAGAGAEEARQILAGAPHTVPPEPCP